MVFKPLLDPRDCLDLNKAAMKEDGMGFSWIKSASPTYYSKDATDIYDEEEGMQQNCRYVRVELSSF
jgi:hypothetical protein